MDKTSGDGYAGRSSSDFLNLKKEVAAICQR
jgi:hypothetical protein